MNASFRFRRLLLLSGVAGAVLLGSCAERHPAAIEMGGTPLLSHVPADLVLGAFGTPAAIDGALDSGWAGVSPQSFTVNLTGNRDGTGKLYLMNDGDSLYFAITLSAVPPQSNTLRLVFSAGGATHTIQITGGGEKPTVTGAEQVVLGSSETDPKRVYEGRKSLPILGISVGAGLSVRFEMEPGGNAAPTYFPHANEFVPLQLMASAPSNQPPVANANGPYFGHSRIAIQFSSAGSSDPDGTIASYHWNFGDGTTSSGPNPTHTYALPGTYTAALTVTDNLGTSSMASTAQVHVAPSVQITVVPEEGGSHCQVTVIARNEKPSRTDDFHVQRADANCKALFGLTAGESYVFSIRNTIIADKARFTLWPNAGNDTEVDNDLPQRLGAVCVEQTTGCTSAVLTPTTYNQARAAARTLPLAQNRDLLIQFQLVGRTIPCSLEGADDALAYVSLLLGGDEFKVSPSPSISSGLGLYTFLYEKAVGTCELKSIPEGEEAVVEIQDESGQVFRGLVASEGTAPLVLDADPDFYHKTMLSDGFGDNPSGKDDIGLVRFGLLKNSAGGPGNVFAIKLSTRAVQENGEAQFLFELTDIRGENGALLSPSAYSFRAQCSKQKDKCKVSQVSPSGASPKILSVLGSGDPGGYGTIDTRLNFTGVHSAKLRVRAGVANGYDYWPNLVNGSWVFHSWTYPTGPGGSVFVPF
jgi:PKD repeat protein